MAFDFRCFIPPLEIQVPRCSTDAIIGIGWDISVTIFSCVFLNRKKFTKFFFV